MRILVTGALGFVGRHLTAELHNAGHIPLLVDSAEPTHTEHSFSRVDITDAAALDQLVAHTEPDACIHLAGIAFVPMGWKDPRLVFTVNTEGTLNLLEAFRRHAPGARVLLVTSAEVYGRNERGHALREDDSLEPENPYALSKMTADLTGLLYAKRYGMHVMTARPQNHIGPGQSPDFVISSFARQLMKIAAGEAPPVLRTGNLESERDFTDVRDVTRAYRLLVESGRAGEAYNIAGGQVLKIIEPVLALCGLLNVHPDIETDPARYRPTDRTPDIDTSRIRDHVGWEAQITLHDTLSDILDDLRATPA